VLPLEYSKPPSERASSARYNPDRCLRHALVNHRLMIYLRCRMNHPPNPFCATGSVAYDCLARRDTAS
jgi:hypothetical protein